MRKHKGMRPHDIVVLLKLITIEEDKWYYKDIAESLYISQAEISHSLERSVVAKLIDYYKKRVNRKNLLEFIKHGLRYVFPAEIGGMVKGVPTAHAHPFIRESITSNEYYVWPYFKGSARGLAIHTLYENQVIAINQDDLLYKALALIDVLRVGKRREIDIAQSELEKMLIHESSKQY